MIRIESGATENDKPVYDIVVEYEQDNPMTGEYIAILTKVKEEVLENTEIDEKTLKEILFGKED